MSIPLSAVTKLIPTVGPLQVNHQGQQPSVTISFNLIPGASLGPAVDAIHKIERELNLPLSVTTGFQGNAQVFQESLKGQGILVLAACSRRSSCSASSTRASSTRSRSSPACRRPVSAR